MTPSDRAIEADVNFLRAALNHATRCARPDGSRLLRENPVRGYRAPKNRNVRRPVATYDRFLAVRKHADDVDPQRLFGSFLELVEALGWRVSAICQLRASDVDRRSAPAAPFGRLRKRGETDKEGVEMWVPLSESGRAALDRVLELNPCVGDMPLFPAPRARVTDRPKPWSRYHARALLERSEKAAKLPALEGSDFHAYRRKWATERKHLPVQDVAQAGGWRDPRCLQTAYAHADEATILAVVTEPRKLREVKGDAEAAAG